MRLLVVLAVLFTPALAEAKALPMAVSQCRTGYIKVTKKSPPALQHDVCAVWR